MPSQKLVRSSFPVALSAFLIVACGGGGGDAGSSSTGAPPTKIDACASLRAADPAAILGEPASEPQSILHNEDDKGTRAVSQCIVSATSSGKSASLLLRYSSVDSNPRTKAELVETERSANTMGMGEEAGQALVEGVEIPALGDLALSYRLFGTNLFVFWEDRYRLLISMNGFDDEKDALERAQKLARRVIEGT